MAVVLAMALLQAWARQLFLMRSGKLGQTILLGLRRRVFDHFQRLSPSFHDKFTSGRVISRLTSDVGVIDEMLANGFDGLVTALLTLIGTSILLLTLDVKLGLLALLSFPALLLLTAWFRKRSAVVYRQTREAVVLVIVHFVESMTGIRAVQAFRREPRNEEIFHGVNDRYREANLESFQLNAIFMPSIKGVGNITIVAILAYGGYQAYHGHVTVGVLTAFLLYLRQFFEPLQDITQFYNTFLSASAALEKLSGVLNEKPDVPEPIEPAKPGRARGHLELRNVEFQYVDGVKVLPGLATRRTGRSDPGPRRYDGSRQDHDRQAGGAVLRPDRWPRAARRRGPAGPHRGRPARAGRDGDAGELPVHRVGRRQHPVRQAGRDAWTRWSRRPR